MVDKSKFLKKLIESFLISCILLVALEIHDHLNIFSHKIAKNLCNPLGNNPALESDAIIALVLTLHLVWIEHAEIGSVMPRTVPNSQKVNPYLYLK